VETAGPIDRAGASVVVVDAIAGARPGATVAGGEVAGLLRRVVGGDVGTGAPRTIKKFSTT
jgi:hypothetical protein